MPWARPGLLHVGRSGRSLLKCPEIDGFEVDAHSHPVRFIGVRNALAEPKTQTDVRTPELEDGQHLWRLAKDTAVLDLNSSYSYLLWCRDFADTSVIARIDGESAGFITGYTRPENPDTLMIWQVAVDEKFRGHGLASTMLHELADRTGALRMETTITDDNAASNRLFQAFADQRGAGYDRRPLFTPEMYPDGHDTEYLYEIAPL